MGIGLGIMNALLSFTRRTREKISKLSTHPHNICEVRNNPQSLSLSLNLNLSRLRYFSLISLLLHSDQVWFLKWKRVSVEADTTEKRDFC
ncbi:unnamed protein product, partial [Vitis vinifera]|uniref:Uncharacterized protein n=1 Tax=Vitis vinifera TaxID=29760 RepID=D7T0W5_VITVI